MSAEIVWPFLHLEEVKSLFFWPKVGVFFGQILIVDALMAIILKFEVLGSKPLPLTSLIIFWRKERGGGVDFPRQFIKHINDLQTDYHIMKYVIVSTMDIEYLEIVTYSR